MKKNHLPKRWVADELEQQYFGDDRKASKMEKKLASKKDRSKYKKTDWEKFKKTETLHKNIKLKKEDFSLGRVLSIVPEGIMVEEEEKIYPCTLRGLLKKDRSQDKNLVTVGDYVLFEKQESGEGVIAHVEPRKSILTRADNLSRRKNQLIAANIDQVLIVSSVVKPALKLSLIDRYIIAAKKGKLTPIVVINKIDLLEKDDVEASFLESESRLLQEILKAYASAGIAALAVSAVTFEGMEELEVVMKDKSSVFSGQSGVGKSSLINAVAGLELEVGDIVGKTKKGSHTTTTANLLHLKFGGFCIDTPGIKSFGVWDLKKEEIEEYFNEIYEHGKNCKYQDCSHTHEAGCAVILALEKEQISPLRYNSYISLIESIDKEHLRR